MKKSTKRLIAAIVLTVLAVSCVFASLADLTDENAVASPVFYMVPAEGEPEEGGEAVRLTSVEAPFAAALYEAVQPDGEAADIMEETPEEDIAADPAEEPLNEEVPEGAEPVNEELPAEAEPADEDIPAEQAEEIATEPDEENEPVPAEETEPEAVETEEQTEVVNEEPETEEPAEEPAPKFTVEVFVVDPAEAYYEGDIIRLETRIIGECAEPVYRWQVMVPGAEDWQDIPGATASFFEYEVEIEKAEYGYRVIVADGTVK